MGEEVSIWSTRDKRGDYVRKEAELKFKGVVTRIEHTFEERGQNSQEHHWVHFVEIFMNGKRHGMSDSENGAECTCSETQMRILSQKFHNL